METGIAGCIINIHAAVLIGNSTVGEHHVGNIAHTLPVPGSDQEAGGLRDHLAGVVQCGDEYINDVPQPGGGIPHAVGNVQPALFGLDGGGTLAVLSFGDGVVAAGAGDDLLVNDGVGDVLAQTKAYAAAGTGVDEIIHGAGVEGVLAVDKLRQQIHIALLGAALGDKVRQTLPSLEVFGADDACGSHGSGQVIHAVVLALGAEHAVDPAVLVLGQAHIVDVGLLRAGVRQQDGLFPEVEALHRAVALCHAKKALAVVALDARHKVILAVQLDGTGVEHGVHAQTLHKVGVRLRVEIEPPRKGNALTGQHRVFPPVVDAVVEIGLFVFAGQVGILQSLLAQVFGVEFRL